MHTDGEPDEEAHPCEPRELHDQHDRDEDARTRKKWDEWHLRAPPPISLVSTKRDYITYSYYFISMLMYSYSDLCPHVYELRINGINLQLEQKSNK